MKNIKHLPFLFALLCAACGANTMPSDDAADGSSEVLNLTLAAKVLNENIITGTEQTGFTSTVLASQGCKLKSSADCWGSYQDFFTDSSGAFLATAKVSIDPRTVKSGIASLSVTSVLRGSHGVAWTFALYNNATQQFDVLGNTKSIPNWKWTALTFPAQGALGQYVNSQNVAIIQLSVSQKNEDLAVDVLAVVATAKDGNTVNTDGGTTTGGGSSTGVAGTTTGGGSSTGVAGPTTGSGSTTGASGTTTGASGTTTGTSGGACWWKPEPTQTWLWDLDDDSVPVPSVNGAKVSNYNADVYDVDMFSSSAAQIATYHNAGKKVVCYVDVGSFEPGRPDVSNFDSSCYCGAGVSKSSDGSCSGSTHKMDGWNEWWFNLSGTCGQSVLTSLTPRLQQAAQKGCDAVEIDNIDAYDNSTGWSITQADEYNFVMGLAQIAHNNCIGIIYKNSGGLLSNSMYGANLVSTFDASLNEQCQQYSECNLYQGFITAKKAAWNAKYTTLKCGAPAGMKTLGYDSTLAVEYKRLNLVCP